MSVKLNERSFEHAKNLIADHCCVLDRRADWSNHKPLPPAEAAFINDRGYAAYGLWHLGEDDEHAETARSRYKFPYGNFKKVHRCAVLAAESRAGQYKYTDIERAAAHLHGMLEELRQGRPPDAIERTQANTR